MAAYRSGIKTVVIPYGNVADLDEVDAKVKEAITFEPVKTVDEVWSIALEKDAASENHSKPAQVRKSSRASITQ